MYIFTNFFRTLKSLKVFASLFAALAFLSFAVIFFYQSNTFASLYHQPAYFHVYLAVMLSTIAFVKKDRTKLLITLIAGILFLVIHFRLMWLK